MPIKEGAWNCSQCHTKRVQGRFKECPVCGNPRNVVETPGEMVYLPIDAQEVTDAALLGIAMAGPDKLCGHCRHPNRGDVTECKNCGNPLDGGDKVVPVVTYIDRGARGPEVVFAPPPREAPTSFRLPSRQIQELEPVEPDVSANVSQRQLPLKPFVVGGAVLVVAVLAFLVYQNFIKTETSVLTVSSLTWERQIEIEEYRTLTESDWVIPDGGHEVRSHQDVHHYVEVVDHYKPVPREVTEHVYVRTDPVTYDCGDKTVDLGNGFFDTQDVYCTDYVDVYNDYVYTVIDQVPVTREDPIYQTKYDYQIDRWVHARWEVANGDDEESNQPRWPGSEFLQDKQRVGEGRQEKYVVTLVSPDDRTYTEEPGFEVWARLDVDQEVPAQVNVQGDLRSIDWPTA